MIGFKNIILSVYFAACNLSEEAKIYTYLTSEEKYILNKLSKKLKNKSVAVEIGSFLGASSCFIANGLNKSSRLYCIDTWGNHAVIYNEAEKTDENLAEKDTYGVFCKNTNKYKKKIIKLRGWSTEVINIFRRKEKKIDFLFIDGDHSYRGVKKDWDLYSPLLAKDSLVAFHDSGWAKGVKRVIREDVLKVAKPFQKLPNLEIYKIKNFI